MHRFLFSYSSNVPALMPVLQVNDVKVVSFSGAANPFVAPHHRNYFVCTLKDSDPRESSSLGMVLWPHTGLICVRNGNSLARAGSGLVMVTGA